MRRYKPKRRARKKHKYIKYALIIKQYKIIINDDDDKPRREVRREFFKTKEEKETEVN